MIVLVIDTALGLCTAAVFDDDRALAVRSEPMSKGHQERVGGLVRDVVAEAGVGFDGLDRIGVTTGPGSFTGLRVGLAFAQGLGAALDRPVVGVSTLAALARSVSDPAEDRAEAVAAVIDARRGQVYVQRFHDGVAVSEPEALPLAEAVRALSAPDLRRPGSWRLIGSGGPLLLELEPGLSVGEILPLAGPTADALAALTRAAHPETAPPSPLYLRAPDATPPTRLPGQPRTPVGAPAGAAKP